MMRVEIVYRDKFWETSMRKLTLLLAAIALAAMPATADAKKRTKPAAPPPPAAQQPTNPAEPGLRVVGGFFQEVGKIGQPRPQPQPAAAAPAKKGKKKG